MQAASLFDGFSFDLFPLFENGLTAPELDVGRASGCPGSRGIGNCLCAKGELDAAGKKFLSDDIVSREPMIGDMAELKRRKAVEGKNQWLSAFDPERTLAVYLCCDARHYSRLATC